MDELRISTDPADVDLDVVHGYLSRHSYWSPGIPRPVVARALANSLCFSALRGRRQVGFARVVTDKATFAWLADVFVLPEARGQGVSKVLMAAVLAHAELQSLRRFLLATADAHGLYGRYGFTSLARPERYMERYRPDAYLDPGAGA
ncbi:GNAT family N-acetyltransferase [Arenimonas fontis]|uniref:GNAT family N-acetyltransferase n=1 Tax=Arenimonas fontis TaxID=2608255 RepID=A0A5B2Z9I2_9GAMM|nr:GNAT family N-acetyltransferase [Arenimonas fontis]KAA2284669.1 GNAT family N-acetyltransferase [Arenimonas fontis]